MRKERVEDSLAFTLQDLPNFLTFGHAWEFHAQGNKLHEHEALLSAIVGSSELDGVCGLYVNSSRTLDFVVITESGLHVVSGATARFVPYAVIEVITRPADTDTDLDLVLTNGHCVSIPILGNTDGASDLFAFYEFLTTILPHRNEIALDITHVHDRESLITLLRQKWEGDHMVDELELWMDNQLSGYLGKLGVESALLQNPDVWRIVALFLLTPESEVANVD